MYGIFSSPLTTYGAFTLDVISAHLPTIQTVMVRASRLKHSSVLSNPTYTALVRLVGAVWGHQPW